VPRNPRILLPNVPFHITHRGNQRRRVFCTDTERREYLSLLARYSGMYELRLWAYSLMPNHVHILAVGTLPESISRTLGNTQRVFARHRHKDHEVTGHLWGARYYASPLDEAHVWAAVRYIERNPVRAGLVASAVDYPWSSAAIHAGLRSDGILDPARPFPGPISDWARWLEIEVEKSVVESIRSNTRSGWPTGNQEFIEEVESRTGRRQRPKK